MILKHPGANLRRYGGNPGQLDSISRVPRGRVDAQTRIATGDYEQPFGPHPIWDGLDRTTESHRSEVRLRSRREPFSFSSAEIPRHPGL